MVLGLNFADVAGNEGFVMGEGETLCLPFRAIDAKPRGSDHIF